MQPTTDTSRQTPTRARRSYLSPAEAAKLAGVDPGTIRTWCERGAVRATFIVGRWRVDAGDLRELLENGRRPAR